MLIVINKFPLNKMYLKTSFGKWRPFLSRSQCGPHTKPHIEFCYKCTDKYRVRLMSQSGTSLFEHWSNHQRPVVWNGNGTFSWFKINPIDCLCNKVFTSCCIVIFQSLVVMNFCLKMILPLWNLTFWNFLITFGPISKFRYSRSLTMKLKWNVLTKNHLYLPVYIRSLYRRIW